ncbi:MAG: hypothetical protein IPN88_15000 [Bacteroidetes bacterium]|nr:hypothetical protein [Bacteroidota bacterium]
MTGIVQVTNAQPAGIYTITIFVGQCAIKNFVLTVEPPSCMVVSILASPIQCYGGASTVTVTATGGTPPYSGTGSFSSVSGTFLFTVSDGGGCTVSNNITIPQSEALPLSATSTATPILCYGNTSQVTVIASGGTPPYAGTGIFTANAGTSSYTITDSIGCTETTVQTINQPLELIASTTQGEISCNGGTTIINVSASGGIAPYSGTGSFTVYSGAFTYTVTDANGCSSTISGAVTEPPMLTTNSSAGLILCNGGTTMVNVTASGGTLPYTGTGSYTVSAGPFSYTVTDANGCSSSTSGNISEPATLVTSASTGVILCNGGSTSIVVSATGGIPPYSGTGSFTATAGSYSYTVSDANGCSSNIAGTITEPTTLTAFSSADLVSCNTSSTTVTVTATGGTLPYSGTGLFSAAIGTHTYSVTDANGCISSTAVTVESNNSPTINSISVSSGCVGDEIILTGIGFTGATAVVFNGTSATSYTILNSNTLAVTIPVGASSGPITVVSASGCIGSSNAFVVFCQTQFTINLTVFIQGYYIGSGMMQPVLLNQLIPGATSAETDTIQVEIYDATTFSAQVMQKHFS